MIANTFSIELEAYRLLIETVKDYAIILLDPNGYVISWNKGAQQIKGYAEHEILGQHFSVFYTSENLKEGIPENNLQLALQEGRMEQEGWRMRKDGTRFWANVVITSLKDKDGQLLGFGKVTRDLTRRKQAEEEISRLNRELEYRLKESQTEASDYKHALDESAIVAVTDQMGIIRYVNQNFCRISKYRKDELIGQDHRIINSGYHSKEFIRDLWATISHGKIWRGELKNKAKDGTFYWVEKTIVPFFKERDKPYQYVAISSNITKRKQAEQQVQKMNEDLERQVKSRTEELTMALEREKQLNELKSRFVSLASHEFRTPLSTILSSLSLLERYDQPEQKEKRSKHVDQIRSSVKLLTDILNDFLSLDKLEHGKVQVMPEPFDLYNFILDTIEELDGVLKKKNQTTRFVHNGNGKVIQDKKILHHILLNLLSNAIKYSGEEKTIYVSTAINYGRFKLSVRDEGIGIPAHLQDQIFSKYFRASNVGGIQGTGLGLNIVKKYVELLEGNISFISKENAGSEFVVELPVKLEPA